jgi:hypothetical protein
MSRNRDWPQYSVIEQKSNSALVGSQQHTRPPVSTSAELFRQCAEIFNPIASASLSAVVM